MIKRNFIGNGSSTVIRRDHLLRVCGYNVTLRSKVAEGCEDVAVYLDLAEHWNFAPVPRRLVGYRQHQASMSRNIEQMQRSRDLVMAELKSRQPQLATSIAATQAARYAMQVVYDLLRGDVRLVVTRVRQARMAGVRNLFLTAARLAGMLAVSMTDSLKRHVWVKFLDNVRPGSVYRLPNDWQKIDGEDKPGKVKRATR